MRICRYHRDGETRLGLVDGETIVDPVLAGGDAGIFADAVAFIGAGAPAREQAARLIAGAGQDARVPRSEARLAAPIMPSTILCAGSNYHAHNAEKLASPTSGIEPEFFIKTSDCVIGPEEGIVLDPRVTEKLDCETELCVVIGRPGRHIPADRALDHVFGYTVANDVTARDRQVRTRNGFTWYELGRGKAFDTSAPIGPVIVTADEIPDPQALKLTTRINGELRQSADTADMIWSCADLIREFSGNFTLKPGMVIFTGTPAGTAWSVDKDLGGNWTPAPGLVAATRYCRPGDVVESEIDAVGVLRNPVVAG